MKKLGADKKVKIAAGFGGEYRAASHEGLPQGTFLNVPVGALSPNPYQPRQVFNEDELKALAESIRERGVITPLCIFVEKGAYFIGGGERRWRASKLAGKTTVPCYVTTGNPAEVGLIENMFRQDLMPIEEAEAYARMQKEFGYTHQDLARVVGKSRNNITETLSLIKLPAAIREECLRVDISKRKLIKIARMETPEAMEAAVNHLLGRKADKPPRQKKTKMVKLSARVEKIAGEIKKLDGRLLEESTEFMQAVKGLNEAIRQFSSLAVSLPSRGGGPDPEEGLHLTGSCRGKLLDAGFRLFRASEHEKVIKELSPTGSWKLVSRHTTKKSMNEALDEILKDLTSVRD